MLECINLNESLIYYRTSLIYFFLSKMPHEKIIDLTDINLIINDYEEEEEYEDSTYSSDPEESSYESLEYSYTSISSSEEKSYTESF